MNEHGLLTKPDRHLGKKALIFGVVGFLFLLVVGYVGTTAWYVIQIKQGKKIVLSNTGAFTSSGSKNSINYFDESILEDGDFPFDGKKIGAEIVIVEFLDYNCPNCRAVYDDLKKFATTYRDQVKIIYRQFPASSITGHEDSELLSKIAWCGYKQGRFVPVHQYLFGNYDAYPHPLTADYFPQIAAATTLQLDKLTSCLNDPKTGEIIEKDFIDGVEAGVRGTPTFFVNGEKIEGAVNYDMWVKYIESLNP